MENQILKTGNRKPARSKNKKIVSTTETGNPVMFVTIEEHQKILDNKDSENIALNNALNASEKIVRNLEQIIKSLDRKITNLNHEIEYLETKLDTIPGWIKYLFGVK